MVGPVPHTAQRPIWLCRECQEPWPCEPARLELQMQFRNGKASLAAYMAGYLTDAIGDMIKLLPDPNPAPDSQALFDRFIAWTNPSLHPDGGDR
ncbi:hypothetical protein GA0070620_3410 [Micromonospora krabiensis]|uniref:Flavin reductase n=1 Tax=Micromonospora krabiensis TaxID=307121 RepID=A0A1C3N5K6_9ACTN|nr:hypothetical protein GA0070620_3410 [Micromonospora krabiensis]